MKKIFVLFVALFAVSLMMQAQENMKANVESLIIRSANGDPVKEQKIREDLKKIDEAYERSREEADRKAQKEEQEQKAKSQGSVRIEQGKSESNRATSSNSIGTVKSSTNHNSRNNTPTVSPSQSPISNYAEREQKLAEEARKSADEHFEGATNTHVEVQNAIDNNANYRSDGRAELMIDMNMGKPIPEGNNVDIAVTKSKPAAHQKPQDVKENMVKPMVSESELWRQHIEEGKELTKEEEQRVGVWLDNQTKDIEY